MFKAGESGIELRRAFLENDGRYERARALALEIEELLEPAAASSGTSAHSARIAQALTGSLVDELDELLRARPLRLAASA